MELGRKIKNARAEASLSQRALADILDVTHGLIGQWEGSHGKKPGRDVLIKLSRATGKPLSYFADNVALDPAILETRVPAEIELVKLFRRMSPKQRATHLALFRQSVAIRAVPKPQS